MDGSGPHTRDRRPAPELDPASEFELWFEVEFDRLCDAAYLATGNRSIADGLAGGAAVHLWTRWGGTGRDHPMRTAARWALNPVRRTLRSRPAVRRRARSGPIPEPFHDADIDGSLRLVLRDMPAAERAALAAVRGLDLTPAEAGWILGRRPATIRALVAGAESALLDLAASRSGEPGRGDETDPDIVGDTLRSLAATDRLPGAFDRHLQARARSARRRRFGAVAAVVAIGATIAVARTTHGPASAAPTESVRATTDVPQGRYQLPGMLMDASVSVPQGWWVGDSIWGADGPGFAALSTGPAGRTVSVAVFDLVMLSPIDPATGDLRTLTADWREGWFRRFGGAFERQQRSRLVGTAGTDPERFRPWLPLAWVLAHGPSKGPIHVAEPVIDGRGGSLVSFVDTGPPSALFEEFGNGRIVLRPGVTYTFWAPARGEALAGDVLVGVAREDGAVAGTEEWNVIGSLSLRAY